MQAIITKYIPATNTRGSGIKATCERGSITIPYPHELSGDAPHEAAAQALVEKFVREDNVRYGEHPNPWAMPRVVGFLPDGRGVHVYATIKPRVKEGDVVHYRDKPSGNWKLCTVIKSWHGLGDAWLVLRTESGNELSAELADLV